jgi:acetyl-CoA synthetase
LYLNNVGDQTELGGCIIQPTAFIDPMKPGAMGRTDSLLGGPAVGVVNDSGVDVPCNTRGNMVFKLPVPGAAHTLWGEHDRYLKDYFPRYDGKYYWFVQDEGVIDEDGYFWVLGRLDDVINVAGHRMTTSEIENVISKIGEVESAAVIGIPDPIKEQVPVAFVKLREGIAESKELSERIIGEVVENIGRIASLDEIIFVKQMPTTISGKIMRRVLRDLRVHGKITGDITTLEDTGSISLLKNAMGLTELNK